MAPRRLPIDPEKVELLAACGSTMQEMANYFGCSKDTLERRYMKNVQVGRDKGKMMLRAKQFDVAMGGNDRMLIWLGKQLLGQKENVQVEEVSRKGHTADLAEHTDNELASMASRYLSKSTKPAKEPDEPDDDGDEEQD